MNVQHHQGNEIKENTHRAHNRERMNLHIHSGARVTIIESMHRHAKRG